MIPIYFPGRSENDTFESVKIESARVDRLFMHFIEIGALFRLKLSKKRVTILLSWTDLIVIS